MNVVYNCDANYIQYTGISITSLFENNKDLRELNVFILGLGINEFNSKQLSQLAKEYSRSIRVIDADDIERLLDDNGLGLYRASRATYYKLFIEQFIPDIIVLSSSEIDPKTNIQSIGIIRDDMAA